MKRQYMRIKHDPKKGTYGDCMRASLATLLGLDPLSMPHFGEDGTDETYWKKLRAFCEFYTIIILEVKRGVKRDDYSEYEDFNFTNSYHLIFGKTAEGVDHAVVGKGFEVWHDPAMNFKDSKAGHTILDNPESEWTYGFIVPNKVKVKKP